MSIKLPSSAPDLQEVAKAWKRKLDLVRKTCASATVYLDSDRSHLQSAYAATKQLLSQSAGLVSAGLTADVIGPALEQIVPGLKWTDHAPGWDDLRNIHLPNLAATIEGAATDIVRGQFTPDGEIVLNYPLPDMVRAQILSALGEVNNRLT